MSSDSHSGAARPDGARSAQIGPAEPRCLACHYDLRATDSTRCPECGAQRVIRLEFADASQYRAAFAALSGKDYVVRTRDPGGDVLNLYSSLTSAGVIWIDMERQPEALAALDTAGVTPRGIALPIVDRADPECPECGERVDPGGPARCAQCGAEFQWISIEEPEVDTTGMRCRECGYELTGLESGKCPECGELLPTDLDALVRVAMEADPDFERAAERTAPARGTAALVRLVATILVFAFVLMFAVIWHPWWKSLLLAILAAGAVAVVIEVIASGGGKSGEDRG